MITSSARRIIKEQTNKIIASVDRYLPEGEDYKTARLEIDTRADTCCFGSNFVPIYFTGEACDVTPFSNTYEAMKDIKICGACTAYDDKRTGETIILEFNQGLWFGNQIPASLINPNQCRHNGISLCDDPFDPYRELGIYDPFTKISIPLEVTGTTVGLTTRLPTRDEMVYCQRIIMTSENQWNPHTVQLKQVTTEQSELDKINDGVNIKAVYTAALPEEKQFVQGYHDTATLTLAAVSATLTPETMVPRLISKVNVATGNYDDKGEHMVNNIQLNQ